MLRTIFSSVFFVILSGVGTFFVYESLFCSLHAEKSKFL